MTTQARMHFQFQDVDGNHRQINRQSFESGEQFVIVAKDLLTSGLGIADICRKYELPDNPTNVDAAFRDGPGQAYLIKLIIEDGLKPHPRFLEYRSGRRVKDEIIWRGYGHLLEDVRSPPLNKLIGLKWSMWRIRRRIRKHGSIR